MKSGWLSKSIRKMWKKEHRGRQFGHCDGAAVDAKQQPRALAPVAGKAKEMWGGVEAHEA
jgi:hypothetical protein